jgi:hypothetical protein
VAGWAHGPTFREGHQCFMMAVHLLYHRVHQNYCV